MTVHQASEHPWIKEEHTELDKRIPASRYAGVRDKMHEKYVSLIVLDFVELLLFHVWYRLVVIVTLGVTLFYAT